MKKGIRLKYGFKESTYTYLTKGTERKFQKVTYKRNKVPARTLHLKEQERDCEIKEEIEGIITHYFPNQKQEGYPYLLKYNLLY